MKQELPRSLSRPVEDMSAHRRIGIMADSHGDASSIRLAARFLFDLGCTVLVHLGDVCDSLAPGTADACREAVEGRRIIALKGNNDYYVLVNHEGRAQDIVSGATLLWLRNLPVTCAMDGADFAHSLPFARELGLVAMIGNMGDRHIRRYFEENPERVLFRGHSHTPRLAFFNNGGLRRQDLAPGDRVNLPSRLPCVVTCGALADGLCMVWDRDTGLVSLHRPGK